MKEIEQISVEINRTNSVERNRTYFNYIVHVITIVTPSTKRNSNEILFHRMIPTVVYFYYYLHELNFFFNSLHNGIAREEKVCGVVVKGGKVFFCAVKGTAAPLDPLLFYFFF